MLFSFVRKMKLLLLLATTLSGVSAVLSLLIFRMIGNVGQDGGEFNPLHFSGVLVALAVVSIVSAHYLSKLSSTAIYNVRMSLIKRVMASDYAVIDKMGTGRVFNMLIQDVKSTAAMVSELPTFIYNLILLASLLSYLCYLSPKLFAVLCGGIFLSALISNCLIRRMANVAKITRSKEDDLMDAYKGMVDGFAQLKFSQNRREHHYEKELCSTASTLKTHEKNFRFSWDLNRSTTSMLVLMMIGLVVTAGMYFGEKAVLLTYVLIISFSSNPFAVIMNLAQTFVQANVSINRIKEFEIVQQLPDNQLVKKAVAPKWDSIRFKDVEFEYPQQDDEEPFHLGPINLEIKRGKTLFVTGGNGSGKSTFVSMLLGLAIPTSGKIYIDNAPIETDDLTDYRELFSSVLASFYLYKNILDDQGIEQNREQLEELLQKFEMSQKVNFKGSRIASTKLSQGQKKRLALITSIVENKDIFVLDEWAADQDPHFRAFFYENIIPWIQASGKTVVAVTHDDRYFHLADECIKFDSGSLTDQPTEWLSHNKNLNHPNFA